jgi:gamma-glutamyltranspeptidase/glutathione hydrolase
MSSTVGGRPHGDRPASNVLGSRSPVLGTSGMVATSQPLASAAALRVLQDGGNAVDAAITAAAVLNVVEPMSTGIGGDMFALVFMQKEGKTVGLNGSGWSGSGTTLDFFQKNNLDSISSDSIHSVSVPGAVAGWFKLHEKYGLLSMSRLLEPAIEYAERGFAVSEVISGQWARSEERLKQYPDTARTYLIDGRAPRHGELFRSPELAGSFREISSGGPEAFYKGRIADQIVACSNDLGGFIEKADLSEFEAEWVEPVQTTYRGYDIFEMPANTQGLVALEILNILEAFDMRALGHNSAEYLHTFIEAKKLAFADRDAYIADPRKAKVPMSRLTSKDYASERRRLIDPARAAESQAPGIIEQGDTVYLSVVDKDRNAVSFINSLFWGFGSSIVAGDTGIFLQNRGSLFALSTDHPNSVAPRKRPFHTLIPAMVLKGGRPCFSFGVMGGDMQPQGHAQVLVNLVDFGMNVQEAGEAPRFCHSADGVALESAIKEGVRLALAEKGHDVINAIDRFGGYQGIWIDPESGVLMGGSDPRKDGCAMGW